METWVANKGPDNWERADLSPLLSKDSWIGQRSEVREVPESEVDLDLYVGLVAPLVKNRGLT